MNARSIAAVAVPALVAGALLGYFIRPSATEVPAEKRQPTHEKQSAKKESRRSERDADLDRLRSRVRDLERQLAAAAQPVETPASNRAERVDVPFRHGPPSAAEIRERMEAMRVNDPERYTQMTNNMARWRARRQERLQSQFNLLSNADTTHMTKSQREVHAKYLTLLAKDEELREMMNPDNTDVTDEQRDAAFREMRETSHELRKLEKEERDTLLTQTANALGLTGKDAAEVVSAIKAVYEATGQGGHGWGGPHGPGGGPGGHGRRGMRGRR